MKRAGRRTREDAFHLATHGSAEPGTLVVRAGFDDRAWLLEDAPETYYLTDCYARYPLVLVRLARVDREALLDLLSVSWRLTAAKAGGPPPGARGRAVRPMARCLA